MRLRYVPDAVDSKQGEVGVDGTYGSTPKVFFYKAIPYICAT